MSVICAPGSTKHRVWIRKAGLVALGMAAVSLILLLGSDWYEQGEQSGSDDAAEMAPALSDPATQDSPRAPPLSAAEMAQASARPSHEDTGVSSQKEAPSVPAGFRASVEQQREDLVDYLSAENLLALHAAWQARAAQGDADAAYRLQQVYEECSGVVMGRYNLEQELQRSTTAAPDVLPADAPARQAALAIAEARFRGLLPAVPYQEAVAEMYDRRNAAAALAHRLGHPISEDQAPFDRAELEAWARQRMRLLLAEGSPEAIFAVGNSLASTVARHDGGAWMLAACELGYPCQINTPFNHLACAAFGIDCEAAGPIDQLRPSMPPRDWRRAEVQRDEILRLLRAGDLEALFLPPGSMRGDPP